MAGAATAQRGTSEGTLEPIDKVADAQRSFRAASTNSYSVFNNANDTDELDDDDSDRKR